MVTDTLLVVLKEADSHRSPMVDLPLACKYSYTYLIIQVTLEISKSY
jgi:hypothetical protein